ncbi:hypothetical protein [Plantactinospora sp. KLBMP9567]|uniref:hypothetical protein n=1 Tax=Plantactinospora sp. KLBMP9567 TaxID=3085900 RepID=UPI00298218FE|nr:hypothetical protein [Plantactinospora sp. KLBMP9567]MDW5323744.1 hypothetical protein [Plantactinospora sp. KLBMP9567]MDW5326864.1 hypothetical protein [Plantactinospora sp. KLBMP9567]
MSETPEPGPLGPRVTLFDHARRLHRQHPDSPLPEDGRPYPDEDLERQRPEPDPPDDRRHQGMAAAAVLDAHFVMDGAPPSELAGAFREVDVPIHRNDHIAAAALRAERERVRRTGRWLVRHATDRRGALVGLALLATDRTPDDIPLIRTIALLSDTFGPLAADALRRRTRDGGDEALLWLAGRMTGWGRVYLVEALCPLAHRTAVRGWLLRRTCDGDVLEGYYAGKAAEAAHLHEAIGAEDADDELIDQSGQLLGTMTQCWGQGLTLDRYPSARLALDGYARHLGRQRPILNRYIAAVTIAAYLTDRTTDEWVSCSAGQREELAGRILAVLDREEWCEVVRASLDPQNGYHRWLAETVGRKLRLRAFAGFRTAD